MSFVATSEAGKSGGGGGPEQQASIAPKPAGGVVASKAGGGGDGAGGAVVEGGVDGTGSVGASTSRRSSRANSFDSVGDVVVVGGVALGNHRGFPGEDWSQSQPGTPSSSQVGWVLGLS